MKQLPHCKMLNKLGQILQIKMIEIITKFNQHCINLDF